MARDFLQVHKAKEINPITEPSTYEYGPPGHRRARTFSQVIAEATRSVDAGMNRFSEQPADLNSSRYAPDWRGHYRGDDAPPVPRADLQLATEKADSAGLYVHRDLLNAQELWDWANAAGIPNLVPPSEMHVTCVYSRKPVDLPVRTDTVIAKRRIAPLGDKGAVVLHFDSPKLQEQHAEAMSAGASDDWPSFQTHVTLTYDAGGKDFSGLEPPKFPLIFGPEIHGPINDNWAEDKGLRKRDFNSALLEKRYSSTRDLPPAVHHHLKGKPKKQRQWRDVFNSALDRTGSESAAFAEAWGAVKG